MKNQIIIIGAGMGGISAALRLRQAGFEVLVIEARKDAGGLASGETIEGFTFDVGPYILLDRPGLEWVFQSLNLDLSSLLTLLPLDPVYEVHFQDHTRLQFHHDIHQTIESFEALWPGSGRPYQKFVESMQQIHHALRPALYAPRLGIWDLLRSGLWKQAPFVSRSLHSILKSTQLPQKICDAISIWTHVAGQTPLKAPSPMAFVPALIHTEGAYSLKEGIRGIPQVLTLAAKNAGVQFRFQSLVKQICCEQGQVTAVELEGGEQLPCSSVVSNAHGLNTYLNLLPEISKRVQRKLKKLPLQSPGICLYLAVQKKEKTPYLRFLLPGKEELCRLFVLPESDSEWVPARLIAPMSYAQTKMQKETEQLTFAEKIIEESWWKSAVSQFKLLKTRLPHHWGAEYQLYQNSMNPVMTSQSVRFGRMPHRSPYVRGLYLAGSATDPGQWVSFCGISGILAADCIKKDFRPCY